MRLTATKIVPATKKLGIRSGCLHRSESKLSASKAAHQDVRAESRLPYHYRHRLQSKDCVESNQLTK